jgi:NAD(P)-dependent dehydrogenase (short-subunit alcohol dehydrogenase family)
MYVRSLCFRTGVMIDKNAVRLTRERVDEPSVTEVGMDLKLQGKLAMVTGASKGIGLACAKQLAEEGCNLHLVSRTAADLERAKRDIQARHNVSVTTHAVDLSSGDAVRALAAAVPDIDILVNNAGAIPAGDLQTIDEARWRQAWDLKVFGYINLSRAVYPAMKARAGGVIVNVLGAAGERPTWGYIAGSAGNAALMAFTRGMGGSSLVDKVRIVACNPGLIRTERMETMLKATAQTKFGDAGRWQELIPTHPPVGIAEQCADLVTFLASVRASHIAGTVVTIDGGAAHFSGVL